jgi:hypothetical protein
MQKNEEKNAAYLWVVSTTPKKSSSKLNLHLEKQKKINFFVNIASFG